MDKCGIRRSAFVQMRRKWNLSENPASIFFVGDGFPVPPNSQTHIGRDGKPVPYGQIRYWVRRETTSKLSIVHCQLSILTA